MVRYIYVLGTYDEHGLDQSAATDSKSAICSLAQTVFHVSDTSRLQECLEIADSDLAQDNPHNVTEGWGGLQLYVLQLQ